MEGIYDVLIIGGGPIGLACAIEAQQRNLKYIVIEKGCLVNSLYNYPLNMTFFSTSDRLEVGGLPFMSLNAKPNRSEALEYYRRVAGYFNLNIRYFERVVDVSSLNDSFLVETTKGRFPAKNVVVATGFYDKPNLMHVPGEGLDKVSHYYKDPAFYAFQKVLVVGANNSSVDAALETWRKGADVTMVVRDSEIGRRVKYWAKPDIENRIAEGSIKAYFNSRILNISETEVTIDTPGGEVVVPNDFVIATTGYQPDFDFLRKIGIALEDSDKLYPDYNHDTMETNIAGIYLAGVVCGGMDTHVWFIENSRAHAKIIMENITGNTVK
ncbi:YpdA family putative bacillithiol disulfide reductase [Polluticaenibacter yanchengensis]|uniref:YpdA family putative bacillithiol disulfide reductase n=1 Tax=Polluticaenibacter yanchengensis TaxID=3014562 RepID=A0ABT4UPY0_9BACT|nr:YpdA family putative bacillithiol disulfide reductase [Chitinophagaceae bacterium LY-5]